MRTPFALIALVPLLLISQSRASSIQFTEPSPSENWLRIGFNDSTHFIGAVYVREADVLGGAFGWQFVSANTTTAFWLDKSDPRFQLLAPNSPMFEPGWHYSHDLSAEVNAGAQSVVINFSGFHLGSFFHSFGYEYLKPDGTPTAGGAYLPIELNVLVPEPSTGMMMVVGACLTLIQRRRG